MRKGRLIISGMLGFWLWLAGLPEGRDIAGRELGGLLPRAHAYVINGDEISGTVNAGDPSINSDIKVKSDVTLTLNANLTATVPGAFTITNNGSIQNNYGASFVHMNIINNNLITNGTDSVAAGYLTYNTFTNNSTGTVVNNKGSISVSDTMENFGSVTNNHIFAIGGTVNNRSGGVITNNNDMGITNPASILNNYSSGTLNNPFGLTNSGTLGSGGTLNNLGTMGNAAGATLNNDGALNNGGLISGVSYNGVLTNAAGGIVNNFGSITNNAGSQFVNNGTINNTGGVAVVANMTNNGILDNYGTLNNTSVNAGTAFINNATVNNYAGATINNTVTFNNQGTVNNSGTVNGDPYTLLNNNIFNNAGTLTGIQNNAAITNTGTATIVYNGIQTAGGLPATATVDNYGTLGEFYNYGTITNNAAGVIAVTTRAENNGGKVVNNGRLENSALFYNQSDINTGGLTPDPLAGASLLNNGVIVNSAGGDFQNWGTGSIANAGTIYNYGSFANTASFTNDGTLPGTLTNTGAIYNYGTFANSGGATLTSSGAIYNYGTFTNAAGSTLSVTGGTVYGTITNNGAFNVSGGSFILPAGQNLSITGLSGAAAFRVASVTAGTPAVTVTTSASGSHSLAITGASAAGTVKAVDLPAGSTATFSGGGDTGAYYSTLARGSALGLDAEDYYFSRTNQPSSLSKAAMGLTAGTTSFWYGEMNEIRKRMGELRIGGQSAGDFWARGYASGFSVRPAGADSYRQTMRGFELGKDNPQTFSSGKKYTGFLVGYGTADNSFTGGASGTTASAYLGAYGSWLWDDGSYFDLIGKLNRFTPRFTTASDSGKYNSTGFGLSAELGKRIEDKNGRFIEPAAELVAMWARSASYTTAGGLAVEMPAAMSLQLRLGVTAGGKWQGAAGASRQVYGKLAWLNEYKGDSTTRVDGAAFDSSLKGHQWVVGLGFIEDSGRSQLYLDLEKSWGSSVSKEWGANAGCRWKY